MSNDARSVVGPSSWPSSASRTQPVGGWRSVRFTAPSFVDALSSTRANRCRRGRVKGLHSDSVSAVS